jgi:hypothetical protein
MSAPRLQEIRHLVEETLAKLRSED